MEQARRCPFCRGSRTLVAEWAYLPAGQTSLATLVQAVRCKWCKGTGRMLRRNADTRPSRTPPK